MRKWASSSAKALVLGIIVMSLVGQCYGQPKYEKFDNQEFRRGFYQGKCAYDVEQIVFDVVKSKFYEDVNYAAAMLRMLFHDCFVKGCDASILLDGDNSEKKARPNGSVRGYELIDAAKAAVEEKCPNLVSCADIIVLVTRDAVSLARGSKGPEYSVKTGRRDGYISLDTEANNNLPSPRVPVDVAIEKFKLKGLSKEDFILLMGGHTTGIVRCIHFQDRIYNFKGTGNPDPSIDEGFLNFLKNNCPQNSTGAEFLYLDQNTPIAVDNGYYGAINTGRGLLQIDNDIAYHDETKYIVADLAINNDKFFSRFVVALNNLAGVEVLTADQGQIRNSCHFVNPSYYNPPSGN
jgi:peroxidase